MKHAPESPTAHARVPSRSLPTWIWSTALAIAATLTHTLIDAHIGLWGESSEEMGSVQALNTVAVGALYGCWAVAIVLASYGDRWALRAVLLFAGVYTFVFHGVVAFISAPPPSAAFPYQDLAHGACLLSGGFAACTIWPLARNARPGGRAWVFVAAAAIIVATQIASGLTFALYTLVP